MHAYVHAHVHEHVHARTQAHLHGSRHVAYFASSGLRTLALAMRELSEQYAAEWLHEHARAAEAAADRDKKLARAAERVESGLTLLGAAALEDRLQRGVPSTVRTLHAAGVKACMHTCMLHAHVHVTCVCACACGCLACTGIL